MGRGLRLSSHSMKPLVFGGVRLAGCTRLAGLCSGAWLGGRLAYRSHEWRLHLDMNSRRKGETTRRLACQMAPDGPRRSVPIE